MQSIKKSPGYLYCFGEHYCDVHMLVYYVAKEVSIAHWIYITYETKSIVLG